MSRSIILDTGPLGKVAHPRPNPEVAAWLRRAVASGALVIIPEIADYELRRNMILEGLTSSLKRLDELEDLLVYMPLTTRVMMKAAEFWAEARERGETGCLARRSRWGCDPGSAGRRGRGSHCHREHRPFSMAHRG